MTSVLEAKELHKQYDLGEHPVIALGGVNFQVEPGEFVAIMGLLVVENPPFYTSWEDWILQQAVLSTWQGNLSLVSVIMRPPWLAGIILDLYFNSSTLYPPWMLRKIFYFR